MRISSSRLWLLVALVAVSIVVSRLSRSLGPVGLVVAIAAIVLVVILARAFILNRTRHGESAERRMEPKDVTPHEPALSPGPAAAPQPADANAAPGPTVVVIEPPDVADRLAAKLEALDSLRADGLVTEAEYETKRAKLIADF